MTANIKAGVAALATVAALGLLYHLSHPGELKQLMQGTSTIKESLSQSRMRPRNMHIPTMGFGEEVFEGTFPTVDGHGVIQREQMVLRILNVEGTFPQVQFDVPKAQVAEYPMKTLVANDTSLELDATGRFGLKLRRDDDAGELRGIIAFNGKRPNRLPTTTTIAFKRIDSPVPVPRDFPPIQCETVQPETTNRYVGTYIVSSTTSITVTLCDNQLFAQTTGEDPLPIFPMGNNRFFYRAAVREITFCADADGNIARIVLHHGLDTPGRKVS